MKTSHPVVTESVVEAASYEGKGERAIEPNVANCPPRLAIFPHNRCIEIAQIVWIAMTCFGYRTSWCRLNVFGDAIEHR